VGKAGPSLVLDQQLAVYFRLQQDARGVAKHCRNLPRFVGFSRQIVDPFVVVKGVHRTLPADQENAVVLGDSELTDGLRLIDQLRVLRGRDESKGYQIVRGVLAFISGIAPAIGLQFAAIRAVDIDLVAVLTKLPVGMAQLTPPETD